MIQIIPCQLSGVLAAAMATASENSTGEIADGFARGTPSHLVWSPTRSIACSRAIPQWKPQNRRNPEDPNGSQSWCRAKARHASVPCPMSGIQCQRLFRPDLRRTDARHCSSRERGTPSKCGVQEDYHASTRHRSDADRCSCLKAAIKVDKKVD